MGAINGNSKEFSCYAANDEENVIQRVVSLVPVIWIINCNNCCNINLIPTQNFNTIDTITHLACAHPFHFRSTPKLQSLLLEGC